MQFKLPRDRRNPSPQRLAKAVVALSGVLVASAALAWQGGGPRPTYVEEVEPTEQPPLPQPLPRVVPQPVVPQPMPTPVRAAPTPAAPPRATTNPTTPTYVEEVEPTEEEPVERPLPRVRPQPMPEESEPALAPPRTTSTNSSKPGSRTPGRTTAKPKSTTAKKSGSLLTNLFGGSESDEVPAESTPKQKSKQATRSTGSDNTSSSIFSGEIKALGQQGTRQPATTRKTTAPRATTEQSEIDIETEEPAEEVVKSPAPREKPSRAPLMRSTPSPIVRKPTVKPEVEEDTPAPRPRSSVAKRTAPAGESDRALPLVNHLPRKLTKLELPQVKDVRPAGFQKVIPGETTASELVELLGEPTGTEKEAKTTVMTFAVEPFSKLEVLLTGKVVDSIIIHLAKPAPEEEVLTELGLKAFRTAPVHDEQGNVLGSAVPERGVALSYEGDVQEQQVATVVLASISAETFLLRANDDKCNYREMLADAIYAASLDDSLADAHALQARLLLSLGRITAARGEAETALQIDEENSEARMLRARILGLQGDQENAVNMAEAVATMRNVSPEKLAQAELLWGDLLAHGANHDYTQAIEHHTKAIKLATKLAKDKNPLVRRTALLTLVDANLAIARDIALGNYKRKNEVVPKWIAKANASAELAMTAGAHPQLALHVAQQTLAAYVGLPEPLDVVEIVDTALTQGQDMIAATDDPLLKQHLEWMLGCALLDAAQIEHARGEFDSAMQYGNNALALLQDNVGFREANSERDYVLGRMYFVMGALYAVGKKDHGEAVHFYLKAIPILSQPLPDGASDEEGRHGERFVSMGVSFWENGNKTQAVELTLTGVEILRQSVSAGQIEQNSLAVPYSNLAAMYKQLGEHTEAKKYAALAQKLEPQKQPRR